MSFFWAAAVIFSPFACAAGEELHFFRQLFAVVSHVMAQDAADGMRLVAVHVDEGVEAAAGTAEKPVDGPFLVALNVVFVKVLEKIFAYVLAQRLFYESQVF